LTDNDHVRSEIDFSTLLCRGTCQNIVLGRTRIQKNGIASENDEKQK